jgi:membrane-associated protease RseP (regulator of RpoE activity)
VKKWPHFDGYGFNLHAEKNKPGQFIGKIDAGSPAEKAGLKEGDRIVEVNGVNVNQENHKQVVQRIKAVPSETKLLVVDKKCEEYHKQNEIIVKSSLSYVIRLSSEQEEEVIDANDDDEEVIDTRLQEVSIEDNKEEDVQDDVQDSVSESSPSPPASVHNGSINREGSMMSNRSSVISAKVHEAEVKIEPEMNSRVPVEDDHLEDKLEEIHISDSEEMPIETEPLQVMKPNDEVSLSSADSLVASSLEVSPVSERKVEIPHLVPEPKKETPNSLSSGSPRSTPSPTLGKVDGLDLNITAKEMRERIGSRKKRDPRKDNRMDFRKKHEIIQTL